MLLCAAFRYRSQSLPSWAYRLSSPEHLSAKANLVNICVDLDGGCATFKPLSAARASAINIYVDKSTSINAFCYLACILWPVSRAAIALAEVMIGRGMVCGGTGRGILRNGRYIFYLIQQHDPCSSLPPSPPEHAFLRSSPNQCEPCARTDALGFSAGLQFATVRLGTLRASSETIAGSGQPDTNLH